MKKSDLKTGHVVETRNGHRFLVVIPDKSCEANMKLIGYDKCMLLDEFTEDLVYRKSLLNNRDIVKVYNPTISCLNTALSECSTENIIWEGNTVIWGKLKLTLPSWCRKIIRFGSIVILQDMKKVWYMLLMRVKLHGVVLVLVVGSMQD